MCRSRHSFLKGRVGGMQMSFLFPERDGENLAALLSDEKQLALESRLWLIGGYRLLHVADGLLLLSRAKMTDHHSCMHRVLLSKNASTSSVLQGMIHLFYYCLFCFKMQVPRANDAARFENAIRPFSDDLLYPLAKSQQPDRAKQT